MTAISFFDSALENRSHRIPQQMLDISSQEASRHFTDGLGFVWSCSLHTFQRRSTVLNDDKYWLVKLIVTTTVNTAGLEGAKVFDSSNHGSHDGRLMQLIGDEKIRLEVRPREFIDRDLGRATMDATHFLNLFERTMKRDYSQLQAIMRRLVTHWIDRNRAFGGSVSPWFPENR